jgi:hypothetical protein
MQERTKENPVVLSTSELLKNLADNHEGKKISLNEIKIGLHERGFAILFIVFSLPLLIPMPLPTGLGTAMSIPIFFFAWQLLINFNSPWLPKWVLKKELNIETFRKIVAKSQGILKFIEKFLKERLFTVSDNRKFEIFTALFIILLNIPIALPFPLSNTLPAISVIVISFGMIEKDGLMILAGYVIGIISWLVCIALGFALFYGANEVFKIVPKEIRDDVKELKEKYAPEIKNNEGIIDNNDDLYHHIKKLPIKDTDY